MKIAIGHASISAMGNFSQQAASAMLRIEGRKLWKRHDWLMVEKSQHNLNTLRELFPQAAVMDLTQPSQATSLNGDPEPAWQVTPRQFQIENFNRFKNKLQWAIFSDPGTGKTKVAIDIMCHRFLKGTVTGVIILSNPKGVHAQWINDQLPKHCWPNVQTLTHIWDGKEPNWIDNPDSRKLEIISGNIDMVRGKGYALLDDFARRHGSRLLFLIDESDCIKSRRAERTKKVGYLAARTQQRAIMTGTPIAKDLVDEWSQFYFLNPDIIGHKYLTSFRSQFCIMGGYENRQVVGHKNLETFKRITAQHIFRATKDELDLPPKVYDEIVFDMADEQRKAIKDIKTQFYAELEGGTMTAQNGAVALLRMQQISNGHMIEDRDNPRLEVLKDLRSKIHGKVIIWCRFVPDVLLLAKHFPTAVSIIGEDTMTQRSFALEAFIRNDATELIATTPSIGRGIDGLQHVCSNAIYYSNSFNAIERWQSEDRIDRIGQTKSCSYFDLIARGSPDRGILRNLRNKKAISEMAIDGLKELIDEIDA